MTREQKWEEMLNNSRLTKENFNDFADDNAIIWAAEKIEKLEKRMTQINETIFAVGAPLGSDNYFTVRKLAVGDIDA